jgi:copper resistance protein C
VNTRTLTSLAVIAAMLAMTAIAEAHAQYRSSMPTAGTTTAAAPDALRIQFTEGIETMFSHVHVNDSNGRTVAVGPLSSAPNDRSVVIVPLTAALRPGRYQVTWDVAALDTHRTQGSYTFTIGR